MFCTLLGRSSAPRVVLLDPNTTQGVLQTSSLPWHPEPFPLARLTDDVHCHEVLLLQKVLGNQKRYVQIVDGNLNGHQHCEHINDLLRRGRHDANGMQRATYVNKTVCDRSRLKAATAA
jgi:hypothetical protein